MPYALDYMPIDRWSQLHSDGGVSSEQAALNEGARRMYVARQRALARHRLTPWFSNSEVTSVPAVSRVRAPRALPAPRRLALPPPAAAVMGWLQ